LERHRDATHLPLARLCAESVLAIMKFGIDRLLADPALRAPLRGRRVALLAHPASVTADLAHSLDALAACGDIALAAAFGPQHGLRGDKQDNMIESPDFHDAVHRIPVFSLYGEVRKPTDAMMDTFDVMLVDLQDLGCRIYTFVTTLRYVIEAAARHGKALWVLDRPNPIGRPVEGLTLREGWQSFVGAGPMPMRHGLTLGELGSWFVETLKLDVDYRVVEMEGWQPEVAPGFGWPLGERVWLNPSPNAPNLWMARAYPGTVMVEGTTLSEGRGTTRPLEGFGAPDINARCAIAGSSRHSTNMSASFAAACKSTPRGRSTITRRSSPGVFRPWPSRRSAVCTRTIRFGAILRTNTSGASAPLTLSMAVPHCAIGWMTRLQRRTTWMRWRSLTKRHG
jgi:uncharacterized protein YbbC (DUF1343 family)